MLMKIEHKEKNSIPIMRRFTNNLSNFILWIWM